MTISNVGPYLLQREQWISRPIEDVFAFFSDAGNLEAITPNWLGFQILTPRPIVMRPGALIAYRLRWHGLALRWLTEIQRWNPPTEFVDVQVHGPYRLWHHTHSFEPRDGRTLIRDVVRYELPFGLLGRLAPRLGGEIQPRGDLRRIGLGVLPRSWGRVVPMSEPALLWFRLDLRLTDNPALRVALGQGRPVIPVFIWSPEEEDRWEPGAASRWWLHQS